MNTPDPGRDRTLNDTERRLLSAAAAGVVIDLRTGTAELDDPAQGMNWGVDRQVRADMLAELLTETHRPDGKPCRAIKLRGARITGSLNLEAANLICPLHLQDCRFDEPVNLDETTAKAISMPGCHLPALTARQLRTTTGGLILNAAFTATGEVFLSGAHIGGTLDLAGASLTNPNGTALSANRITVEHSMFCEDGFTATGEVGLHGAHIGGTLVFKGGSLTNPNGMALDAEQLTVDHGMFCGDGFTATGEVSLYGAHISGTLELGAASFANPGGMALCADRITVEHSMFCGDGFTATGEVSLYGAHISGELDLNGASLTNRGGTALQLMGASASTLRLPSRRPDGTVDLTNARVGAFFDDPAGWPAVLRLRGFVYDSLGDDIVSARARLRWLARHQSGYTPQPYDQLAGAYRRAGDEQAARKIAVAKQWRRRRAFNPLNWLWYVTVGYGYRTGLALIWLAALAGLGTWVFSGAYPAHMTAISAHPPAFHAAAYALDLLVPVVGLGQKSAWQPQGAAMLYWSWALTVAGWVLTTAVAAGLTGILRRG